MSADFNSWSFEVTLHSSAAVILTSPKHLVYYDMYLHKMHHFKIVYFSSIKFEDFESKISKQPGSRLSIFNTVCRKKIKKRSYVLDILI